MQRDLSSLLEAFVCKNNSKQDVWGDTINKKKQQLQFNNFNNNKNLYSQNSNFT